MIYNVIVKGSVTNSAILIQLACGYDATFACLNAYLTEFFVPYRSGFILLQVWLLSKKQVLVLIPESSYSALLPVKK
jgi:hypothetical protein